jgi:hypothetical protein
LFAALLLLLYPYYKSKVWQNIASVTDESPAIRAAASQLYALHPAVPERARMFFLHDPYRSPFAMLVVVRLTYRDDSIVVDRLQQMDHVPGQRELASYDYVFDYDGSRLVEKTCAANLRPAIVITAGVPEFYHLDWLPVTAGHPAHPGEAVVAKATGLGITSPEVAPDQPFPVRGIPRVMSRIAVRVNGRPSEILNQLGWPELANTYRVDFRVPPATMPGAAQVNLTVRDAAAAPVTIPVERSGP